MDIPITFLGTSQAIPTATRNHTSILVNYKNENILVDCGEGTQRQFRKAKLNPLKITRILITHWHGDHVLGLAGLFQTLVLSGYNKTLHIYGPKGTKKFTRELISPFIPVLKFKAEIHEVNGKFLETGDFFIEAVSLEHGIPTNGYVFKEKDKHRINKEKLEKLKIDKKDRKKIVNLTKGKNINLKGKQIKYKDYTYLQKGKKIAFVLDTRYCKNALKMAKDADLAIIESTYSDTEKELAKEHKHLTAKQAAEIAKKSKTKKLILTHISQRYEHKEKKLEKEAKKVFKNSVLAHDLMKVVV